MVELKTNLNNSSNENISSKILIELISQKEGGYTVLVPDLPGCISEGDTKEEALKKIAEAIDLYLKVNNEQINTKQKN
ncbi:MAG: type II toxin-antitoxin system HicB family antitoxin [Candidatus Caenarcaniphilales bacterium]|nr:type II toxin-antitoxin system HicB family antitoxin [Candidatus Caenarcaniphilales bacterium]